MRDALDRTLLLMRDDLQPEVMDAVLIEALNGVTVVVRCAEECARSHAGQSALVALCALLARSGHRVHVDVTDAQLAGRQPPARAVTLVSAIAEVAGELPTHLGTTFGKPIPADLEILIGDCGASYLAARTVRVGWGRWVARIADFPDAWDLSSQEGRWPMGALAAAALAAGEAFKIAMRCLATFSRNRGYFDAQYAETRSATVTLAPEHTPTQSKLDDVDFISAGAITNAALYSILRVPGLSLKGRVFDDDSSALSNLNRNMLLLKSSLEQYKVAELAAVAPEHVLEGVVQRFGQGSQARALSNRVLVGVDHIPSRWTVQRAAPGLVVVGATSHFMAIVSVHPSDAACAGCMHPRDEPDDGLIPTVAFVSFWAGLLTAVELLRNVADATASTDERQTAFWPLRPESTWRSPVPARIDCPTPCAMANALKGRC